MDNSQLSSLIEKQQSILSKIALGQPLNVITEEICTSIEEMLADSSSRCSILKLNGDQLFHCAAPNIASGYCEAINGVKIGPKVGSCGTAAFKNKQVIVENIETDPLWSNAKHIALKYDLKSCWSTPILSSDTKVLGTFAVYHGHPCLPSKEELRLIDYFVDFSSIALERAESANTLEDLIKNLEQSNERFKAFTHVMPDLALVISEQGEYCDMFGSAEELLILPWNELKGKRVTDVMSLQQAKPIQSVIEKTIDTKVVQVLEYELEVNSKLIVFESRTAPLNYFDPSDASQRHVLWMVRDITARKEAERNVERLAYYDPLTELPNRRMLHERLELSVNKIKRSHINGALLFLDLDNFKRVNDSLGHAAGDAILVEVARRLSSVVRQSDLLARISGDEFVVLLEYIGNDNTQAHIEARCAANKLHSLFKEKFNVGNTSLHVSCSIGICLVDGGNLTSEQVLKFADTAMYRSKLKGGDSISFYDANLQTMLEKQVELETDIVRAIDNKEFCAYFQPQVDLDGNVIGAEALIRWLHPTKGIISPLDFIPVAEQFGLIQRLQNIVLTDICHLLLSLDKNNQVSELFNVSINISAVQFKSASLKEELMNIINQHCVSPTRITLEITESMLIQDVEHTRHQMEELTAQGFELSIDDFGTGYSCLSYLNTYPVRELKIDKSFIDNMLNSKPGGSIVEGIVNLTKNLDINVVAEGVETSEQLDRLRSYKIDAIQGYLIAKPMPIAQYISWHRENV